MPSLSICPRLSGPSKFKGSKVVLNLSRGLGSRDQTRKKSTKVRSSASFQFSALSVTTILTTNHTLYLVDQFSASMSAAKRKLADVDSEAMGHGRDSTPGGPSSKRSKTQKVKPDNMPWVRKRARTIERLLRTSQDLPANVQNDLERELGHHRSRIAKSAEDKQRKDMISKYHMVRFFGTYVVFMGQKQCPISVINVTILSVERKKADRLAKRLRTQLGSTEDEAEKKDIAANLRVAEMDGVYARFFPHRERYISLYPVAESGASAKKEDKAESASKAVQALKSERPPIWYEIERAERKGMSALVAIRERNLNASFGKGANATELPTRQPKRDDKPSKTHPERPIMAAKAAKAAEIPDAPEVPMNRRTRREHERSGRTQKVAEDNDSDGGFFE